MKKRLLIVFVLFLFTRVGFAQHRASAVRLNTGVEVTNTIFWKNSNATPISSGVLLNYSALDSMVSGGVNNIHLLNTPFVDGYRINSASPVYNAGKNVALQFVDTLDLDYNPRVSCDQMDMGAYEYEVIATKITVQPSDQRVCERTPVSLQVAAEGTQLTYQWQCNGVDLIGQTATTLSLAGNITDTGTYRVIVHGDCCNDTSVNVRVDVDLDLVAGLMAMNDTTICIGESVQLTTNIDPALVIWKEKSTGDILSYNGSTQDPVVDPLESTVYQAWVYDKICGDVFEETTVIVQPKPDFKVQTPLVTNGQSAITLVASPNASYWTLLDGTKVFNPVYPSVSTTYMGWYIFGVCVVTDTAHVIVVPDTFHVSVVTGSGCFDGDGWAEADVTGTTAPYTFLWSNGQTDSIVEGLNSGHYTVSVTDKNGTIVVTSLTIPVVSPIQISYSIEAPNNKDCNNGRIKTAVTGGTPVYDYVWSDGSVGQNQNIAEAGVYALTVTDSKGCEQTVNITLPCSYKRVMPTLFITPNADGKNDFLKIVHIENYPHNRVVILNAYGEEVNKFENYNNTTVKWDGRNKKGEVLPDGVYYYIVEAEGLEPMAGWLFMKLSKMKLN